MIVVVGVEVIVFENGGCFIFLLDSCSVSTAHASASADRRGWKQLGRVTYQTFGDLGTTGEYEIGVTSGRLKTVVGRKGAVRKKDQGPDPGNFGERARTGQAAMGDFARAPGSTTH